MVMQTVKRGVVATVMVEWSICSFYKKFLKLSSSCNLVTEITLPSTHKFTICCYLAGILHNQVGWCWRVDRLVHTTSPWHICGSTILVCHDHEHNRIRWCTAGHLLGKGVRHIMYDGGGICIWVGPLMLTFKAESTILISCIAWNIALKILVLGEGFGFTYGYNLCYDWKSN